ncbi:hypothetical protein [Pumilibacter intestinalis]|uniref:hypothetical protein n=1 Tax=Pumilibacter intestinalis TaxID=2941511 RepID=UPI00203D0EA4|nr:hypothetical protein [Pumilibacter intestinalis]
MNYRFTKRFVTAVAFVLAAAFAICMLFAISSQTAAADEAALPVNIFAMKSDWQKGSSTSGLIEWNENGGLSITPVSTVGTVYTGAKMGEGKISFTYKLEYDEGLDPMTEETRWNSFFGVMFGNSPTGVTATGPALACPWEANGGYPYMLAFNTEVQGNKDARMSEFGMQLRRYGHDGDQSFTKWNTVNPVADTDVATNGRTFETCVPEFFKPITIADCYDESEHNVEIEVKYLYKANGDEKDAIKIDVTFDGEKCLTVIDEMPFEGEELGDVAYIDKREDAGYISWFAYDPLADATTKNFTIHVNKMTATFDESTGVAPAPQPGTNGSGDKSSGGCGSVTAGTSVLLGILALAACAAAVTFKKKQTK